MKITTFNPQIITKDAETAVQLFEALGFEHRHTKEAIGDLNVTGIRMKDQNGFYLDILQSNVEAEHGTAGIRMNVDDFDEAYQTLLRHGYQNAYGDETVNTKSSKAAMMRSPSGFSISIIQHIK